ncbi:MAG: ferrous iron transport protein B [Bacillota bacterium]
MGLTKKSTGWGTAADGLRIIPEEDEILVALAGNPNVGKSTVFNSLTGMNQHTGNWPGKTVAVAGGRCKCGDKKLLLVDIPGTYSLLPHSAEEEVAGEYLCFGKSQVVVVVCDATCLERNLNLVLQVMEVCKNVVVCLNMQDEAKRKGIVIDDRKLSEILGVPVVLTAAGKGKGLDDLLQAVCKAAEKKDGKYYDVNYGLKIERSISEIKLCFFREVLQEVNGDWLALRVLADENYLHQVAGRYLADIVVSEENFQKRLSNERQKYKNIEDEIAAALIKKAEKISRSVMSLRNQKYNQRDRRLDAVLTGKYTGLPIMVLMMAVIFWITIVGANYPSGWLSGFFGWLGIYIEDFFQIIGLPSVAVSLLMDGVYLVVTWVVAVMLPPMAIFFPLFTLLEDLGYLPRVAFNLDKYFKRCSACGKQALTMCMGFGCNAAGIVGCRIIDSPRERMIAMLTNVFVPCNGRFPAMIAIISMFLVGALSGFLNSLASALILAGLIVFGILMTFLISWILSKTLLKGMPSSFTLELPPYRKPQVAKVIVRSVFDRTLFVLGRALVVAAPAGLLIWVFANVQVDGGSLLAVCSSYLDPFARWFGLDGVILLAFILGLPANEIVLPLMMMAYLSMGSLTEINDLAAMQNVLQANGWTLTTAVCVMLFYLMHWPCATTLLTIKKESGSWKWTVLAFIIPAVAGLIVCFLFCRLVGFVHWLL